MSRTEWNVSLRRCRSSRITLFPRLGRSRRARIATAVACLLVSSCTPSQNDATNSSDSAPVEFSPATAQRLGISWNPSTGFVEFVSTVEPTLPSGGAPEIIVAISELRVTGLPGEIDPSCAVTISPLTAYVMPSDDIADYVVAPAGFPATQTMTLDFLLDLELRSESSRIKLNESLTAQRAIADLSGCGLAEDQLSVWMARIPVEPPLDDGTWSIYPTTHRWGGTFETYVTRRVPAQFTIGETEEVFGDAFDLGDAVDTTSTAVPAATTPSTDPGSPAGTVRWEVVEEPEPGVIIAEVIDTSLRNIALDPSTEPSTIKPATQSIRSIVVQVSIAVGPDGTPDYTRPHPLLIRGTARTGLRPGSCVVDRRDVTTVCVGFPGMTTSGPSDAADVPNFPGDVSAVLDVLLAEPSTFGAIDTGHVVYTGSSLLGIAGVWFVHPLAHDTRITAIVASVAFAPYWLEAFNQGENWDYGPRILMVNGTDDTTITYALIRSTIEAARGAMNIRLLTVLGGTHDDPFSGCGVASRFAAEWLDHELLGGDAPADAIIDGSGCSAFGIVEGGTTGTGAAGPFIPAT